MKKVIALVLMIVVCLSIVSCGNKADTDRGGTEVTALDQGGIQYNYSAVKTHNYESFGYEEPASFNGLCQKMRCLVEFTVTGDGEAVVHEFYENNEVQKHEIPVLSIKINDVVFQDAKVDVNDFDEIGLLGAANKYADAFPKGTRVIAFCVVDGNVCDFSMAKHIWYIDENECLVPFFDIEPYSMFAGTSLEDFKARALEVRQEIKE